MSCVMVLANIEATPLAKNSSKPTARSHSLILRDANQPASITKGIISNDGSDESICTSNSDADGNIRLKSSKTGDTASPGNDVTADTDHIASRANKPISPLPVDILITKNFFRHTRK